MAFVLAEAQVAAAAAEPQSPSVSAAADPTSSLASNDSAQQLDIIVTASRQSVGSQKVPISLTAVSGGQLAKQGIVSATDISRIAPSLYVLGSVSAGSPRYSIRGLTGTDTLPAGSAAVATYIDDVYQASQFGVSTGLYDIQRVEVLRGPQGTTFGKNTTGGAVAYFSQTPTNIEEGYVNARLSGGDQAQRFIEGAINVPLTPTLAMRLSGRFDSKSNFIRDIANGSDRGGVDNQSGRFQLAWTPSSDTKVNLYVFGTRNRGDQPMSRGDRSSIGISYDPNVVNFTNRPFRDNYDNYGSTLRIEQKLGNLDLISITHYRATKVNTQQDLDSASSDVLLPDFLGPGADLFVPGDLFVYSSRSKATQYGQEFRLSTDRARPISGLLGVYGEKDKVNDFNNESSTTNGPPYDFNNVAHYVTKTNTYAIFANVTVRPTSTLSFIGGIRKSWETRKIDAQKDYYDSGTFDWTDGNIAFTGPAPAGAVLTNTLAYNFKQKNKPWTWDATVNYNPSNALLIFARAAKGVRSGGFNPAAATFADAVFGPSTVVNPAPFLPESVQSYEIGVKSTVLGGKLRVNAGVFRYDYNNQQVTQYPGGIPTTTNAASSRIKGAELEIQTAFDARLELGGSLSYTDAKYRTFLDAGIDRSGNTLGSAPGWTANAQLGYSFPLSANYNLRPNTTWSYRSRIYFDTANSLDLSAPKQAIGNFRLALEPTAATGFSVAAFVNNVTDRRALASGFPFFPGVTKYYDTGRIYGLDVSFRW